MTDKEEMDFITRHVTSRFWIGGQRSCHECSTWEWINGGVIKYFNWNEGEPNNVDSEIGDHKKENCIESINGPKRRWPLSWSRVGRLGMIFPTAEDGRWNDLNCGVEREFLCKSV